MIKNVRVVMGLLIVVTVLLAACGDGTDSANADEEKESQSNNAKQTTNKDTASDSTEKDSNNEKINEGTQEENDPHKDEATSTAAEIDSNMHSTATLKEEYLHKIHKLKDKVEEMRENPVDNTAFALKKVEGEAFDMLDGLLNEIYGILQEELPTVEMEQLRKEQREWIQHRDNSAKEASLAYQGGTMEQLEYVTVQNKLTEERCKALVENYM